MCVCMYVCMHTWAHVNTSSLNPHSRGLLIALLVSTPLHIRMSHATHMHEACHAYAWDMHQLSLLIALLSSTYIFQRSLPLYSFESQTREEHTNAHTCSGVWQLTNRMSVNVFPFFTQYLSVHFFTFTWGREREREREREIHKAMSLLWSTDSSSRWAYHATNA